VYYMAALLRTLILLVGARTATSFMLTTMQPATRPQAVRSLAPVSFRARSPIANQDPPAKKEQATDLIERASDPFRVVRVVIYVVFGVAGVAGCGIAVTQMGSNPSESLGNLAVNAVVLAVGIGVFFFDQSVTKSLREKMEKEMENPYLKGGVASYMEDADEANGGTDAPR